MADSTPGHGFDPGVQPERTAEQLAAIHEAMMVGQHLEMTFNKANGETGGTGHQSKG